MSNAMSAAPCTVSEPLRLEPNSAAPRRNGRPGYGLDADVLRLRETYTAVEVAERLAVSVSYVRKTMRRHGARGVHLCPPRGPQDPQAPRVSAEERAADDIYLLAEWLQRLEDGRGTLEELRRSVAVAYARRAIRLLLALLRSELSWHRLQYQARVLGIGASAPASAEAAGATVLTMSEKCDSAGGGA